MSRFIRELFFLILLSLNLTGLAQTKPNTISAFKNKYFFNSDLDNELCAGTQIAMTVHRSASIILCDIDLDGNILHGRLSKNEDVSNKDRQGLYNFFQKKEPNKVVLFIRFYKQGGVYKADIINEKWLPFFKPCFDRKLITSEAD